MNPGEPLILGSSPVESALRFGAVMDALHLSSDDLAVSSTCALPVPVASRRDGPLAKFAEPSMAWLPLAWLPNRLLDQDVPASIHTLSIMLELTASGVYDPVSAEWIDILAMVGIDVDLPSDVERITKWQQGAHDPLLDAVSLDQLMTDTEYPDWSIEVAVAIEPDIRRCSMALGADALLMEADALSMEDESALVASMETIVALAMVWTLGDPEPTDWTAISANPDVGDRLASLIDALTQIRERYWAEVENLPKDQLAERPNVDVTPIGYA